MQVSKLAQTCAPAGFRHAREAEIDAIGEDDGEKRIAIVGLPARTSVDEAFAEPGPSIDLKQQVGDLHPWQAIIGCATGNFGSGRRCRLQRRDDEAVFVKPDLGQLALSREDRYLFDGRVEPGAPFLNMALEIRFDGERSEEHTSELQSLMRISYAVFCLKKKKHTHKPSNIKIICIT